MPLSNRDMYTQEPTARITATVVTKYEAQAYRRYDGSIGYYVWRDGVDIGTDTPLNLLRIAPEWEAAKPVKEKETPAPQVTVTPTVRATTKTVAKAKAASTKGSSE